MARPPSRFAWRASWWGSWTANVDNHTWKTRTFTGINIAGGAEIRIEAAREEGEHARVDFIEIR